MRPSSDFLTPHARLLGLLVQRREVRTIPDSAAPVLLDAASRRRFLRLARELGVEGLALAALSDSPLASRLTPDVAQELDARRAQLRKQAMLWDLERERVLLALGRQGVSPVLLKGSALREIVYRNPVERSMGDLDLFADSDAIEPSMAALMNAGYTSEPREALEAYRRHHFHYQLHHPRGFIVELHWALAPPGSPAVPDERQMVVRATTLGRGANAAARVPSPEDLLLHLVSQNEDDAFGLLRRIADLDRIVAQAPQFDWDYVVRTAHDAGLGVVLAVSLRLAQVLLLTELPQDRVAAQAVPRLSRAHIAMLQPAAWTLSLPSERRPTAFDMVRLWCTSTWRRRISRLAALAFDRDLLGSSRPGADRSRWSVAGAGVLRLTKIALYQLQIYGRTGLAVATPEGRRRLRFWS